MAATAFAIVAAAATALVLPATAFRAQAVITVVDPASPLSLFLPKTAAALVVSKPVVRRAAESLIGTGFQAPEPDIVEKIALASPVGGTQATGKTARLAADLSRIVGAQAGALPGSLEITAAADAPERSALIADALAEALIADQEDTIAKGRHARDVEAARRIDRLRAEAEAARKRLASLGGVEVDPTQMRATAAAQVSAAKARADMIRAIVASGSPPLSDRRDVPSAIESLQATYLDLSRQLAKARETLGDRHTTIIGLQAEVKRAAANLTSEWRRLSKLADGELAAAREHEASLRKAEGSVDMSRRSAVDEARRSVQAADDAIARARAQPTAAPAGDQSYHMLLPASVPNTSVGLSLPMRVTLGLIVGIAVFLLALRRPKANLLRSLLRMRGRSAPEAIERKPAAPVEGEEEAEVPPMREDRMHSSARRSAEAACDTDKDLMRTMFDLVPELEAISPAFGPLPTIMIAANDGGTSTTHAALALGRAAAEHGLRALVVEASRPQTALAAAASDDDSPILVDLFGNLRVALRAETADGLVYLVPNLEHGPRIASALARERETPIVDDIAAEFDLIIVDGGEAEACAAEGWGADAYLRVGRFDSHREEAELAQIFDAPQDMILGTIVASSLRRPKTRKARPHPGTASSRAMPKAFTHRGASPARSVIAHPVPLRRKLHAR